MAKYFKNPAGLDGMLPTIEETAAYYREAERRCRDLSGGPERETGFRRYSNEQVAETCAENADILIPCLDRPPQGQSRRARGPATGA